ncbi:MAG: zinc ribbon domain-containing protein [Smithellaceae bacterium]|jgi:putative FmdB family regulatory protein
MPLYEYKCLKCGKITEVLRSIKSRDGAMPCNSCGFATERIISSFNSPIISSSRKSWDSDGAYENNHITKEASGTGIRLERSAATIKNCIFENMQTGISMSKGSKLSMNRNKFIDVTKPVEVTDE